MTVNCSLGYDNEYYHSVLLFVCGACGWVYSPEDKNQTGMKVRTIK